MTMKQTDDKYIITHEFTASPAIVSAKDYPGMLELEASLGRNTPGFFCSKERRDLLSKVAR